MIMIIGSEREYHAKHIYDRLKARNQNCFYLDTAAFPTSMLLNLHPDDQANPGHIITETGEKVPIQDIKSVYWRYHHGIQVPEGIDREIYSLIYREIESAVGSFFRNMPHIHWVNPPSAIERHRYKAHQLYLMVQAGIPVPDTLISNDPEAVRAFCEHHQNNVIFKPVSGGAHTAKITADDLTDQRLQELSFCPVQFQECIDGVDIRVYVIGDKIFAAEIQANTIDFRDHPEAPIVPIDIPEDVQAHCFTLAEIFEYQFTGIDIRRTPDGRHVFIEGNPSPMFVYFEKQTGYPLTESLMDLLALEGASV